MGVSDGDVAKGIRFPPKLEPIFKPMRFKVLWGGRDAGRSWGASRALLTMGVATRLRILCGREIQRTLADSVHRLLLDQIKNMGLDWFYYSTDSSISGKNGTEFIYAGLRDQDASKVKSYEGVDIVWIEEAETLTKKSLNVLEPTIRKTRSDGTPAEIWMTLNVQMDSDEVYKRFISNTPADAVVIKMTWRDNPWASPALASGRERMKREDPDEYDNIWEGNPRSSVAGAIYAKEVASMIERKRARPLPYDPQLPVHTVWDLGWNDAMSIILVQRVSSAVMVIGYLEASGKTYAECVAELKSLKYVWGTDWLPHDGKQTRPDTGKNPKQIIEGLGRKSVKIIDDIGIENGIRAVRMMFPRLYIDNTEFKNDSWEFDGGARLIECPKRYRRSVPASTGEPGSPVHDEYSHGADSVRGLAVIVDQIINEGDMQKFEVIPSMAILDSVVGL